MTDVPETNDDDISANDGDTITGNGDGIIPVTDVGPLSPFTSQTVINAFTINTRDVAGDPRIATRADGIIFAAYASPVSNGHFLIKGQSFDASGQKNADEVTFAMGRFPVDQSDFDITILPNGQVAVSAHVDTSSAALISDLITTAIFEISDGTDPIFQSRTGSSASFRGRVIDQAVTGTQGGHQSFTIKRNIGGQMFVRQFTDENGETTERTVANFNRNNKAEVDAITLGVGNTVMILDRNGNDDDGDGRILYKVFGPDGQEIGGGETGDSDTNTYDVTVTRLKSSAFVIAWTEADGFDTDVQFQLFSSEGEKLTPVANVGNSGGGARDNNNEPTIVALEDFGFIIFYDDDNGDNKGINGQRYSFRGEKLHGVFRISNQGFAPDATLMPNGEIAVSYRTIDGDLKVEIIQVDLNQIKGTSVGEKLIGTSKGDLMRGFEGDDRLTGLDGDDVIHGGDGDDTLVGGAGNDRLYGGAGSDRFVFGDGHGNDEIMEFDATDDDEKIELRGITGLTDFDVLLNDHMQQVGDDVVIDFGSGDTLTLRTVQLGDLNVDDFLFSGKTVDGTGSDD